MKLVKSFLLRLLLTLFYLAILSFLFRIPIRQIVNLKELFLVIVGAFLFIIPQVLEKEKFTFASFCSKISSSSLCSGIFTSVVLMVLSQNRISSDLTIFQTVFVFFRPAVYGIICFILCKQNEKKETQSPNQNLENYYKSKGLSKREIEVAKLAAKGLTNREIAEELFIEVTTVKRHLYVIFEKLEISKREELNKRCF